MGGITQNGKVEVNVEQECELTFKYGSLRSTKCKVSPGDWIVLSFIGLGETLKLSSQIRITIKQQSKTQKKKIKKVKYFGLFFLLYLSLWILRLSEYSANEI